jgi:N-methylhydantoinase A/oxoprolinase/acetone carboxylase beta subunit
VRVGVDTGGTFTDLVAEDGRVRKVPSTRRDPASALEAALAETGRPAFLAHGTTVATNALLERSGPPVALVTNEGFADVIEIGRQDRPRLYDLWADRPEPLVPRGLRLEVRGRLDAWGREVEPLGPVPEVPPGVGAVAVCLLHADLCDRHERAVEAELLRRGHDVCRSSAVSPEHREYERTVTTVVNAYVRPACRDYLARLGSLADETAVMVSSGGLVPLAEATERPVALVVSGPAAGALAAARAAAAAGWPGAVSFDMGGTSTDVCLVSDGAPAVAAETTVASLPVRLPAVAVRSIGAGGGSIARLDPGGALVVGPRSAGADPGPACYGRGGIEPTVTDADLVAGRLPAGLELPGVGRLDAAAARRALARAGLDAIGVLSVADAAIVEAVRSVTVAEGVDPRDLALVAFGGAGPLHAAAVAEALGMPAVLVPPRAGVLSAVGLLEAPRRVDLVRSWPSPLEHEGLSAAAAELAQRAGREARRAAPTGSSGPLVEVAFDCRYAGQSHELTVASVEAFPEEHRRRNGFVRPGVPVEVVAIRARATVAPPPLELPPPPRHERAVGPCALVEPDTTVWVPEGWRAELVEGGAWRLWKSPGSARPAPRGATSRGRRGGGAASAGAGAARASAGGGVR